MKKIFIFIFFFNILYGHPHYFLEVDLKIDENKITNNWIFDRLNSKILMFDFDKNKNKILDENEKKDFLKVNFFSLEKNNYNLFLADDKNEYKIIPKNIDVVFNTNRLNIIFELDYKTDEEFTFCTMDEKIYLAYKLKNLKTKYKNEIQKSEYDFCIGVKK